MMSHEMGGEFKSPKVTQVRRFLNVYASLGCDSLIFGILCIVMNVELFYILKSVVGLGGMCANSLCVYVCFFLKFSSKVSFPEGRKSLLNRQSSLKMTQSMDIHTHFFFLIWSVQHDSL